MKVLIIGANGFIGKNLVKRIETLNQHEILKSNRKTSKEELKKYLKEADFIFHLAGVNRPENNKEFNEVNFKFTKDIIEILKENKNKCKVMFASSIQAENDTEYGISKKKAEEILINYSIEMKTNIYIYRFNNLFGKFVKPNYNSVIATFCYNIARNIPIKINDEKSIINFTYIDDVIDELINNLNEVNIMNELEKKPHNNKQYYYNVEKSYKYSIGEISKMIYSFKESRETNILPDTSNEFIKKLYSTYLSYLPENDFYYNLKMNIDERGSFTEMLKSENNGQVSINISKPGVIKGNHYHNTKVEKFLVVKGEGIVRFRNIEEEKIIEYTVTEEKLQVIDVPVGYTHNIENTGKEDMVTVMWANEIFNKEKPDTFFCEV